MIYYNEFEPYAARWLENLIEAGHLPAGYVDDRSITDVSPNDLKGFTSCHFFAGIGGWPLALRMAGWPDDRPVWTGSCPCQPFSAAGNKAGFDDPRHLWPTWFRLVRELRPVVVFGEQVASPDGLRWLDLVSSDMEGQDYAFGAVDLCAASVGAPQIRQRLWFVGERLDHAASARRDGPVEGTESETRDKTRLRVSGSGRGFDGLANADRENHGGRRVQRPGESQGESFRSARERPSGLRSNGGLADAGRAGLPEREGNGSLRREAVGTPEGETSVGPGDLGRLGDAASEGRRQTGRNPSGRSQTTESGETSRRSDASSTDRLEIADDPIVRGQSSTGNERLHGSYDQERADPFFPWRDADWLFCTDGKWRSVEPFAFPLAHGVPARVGRLRAYGNAIVPQVAATFIDAYLSNERTL